MLKNQYKILLMLLMMGLVVTLSATRVLAQKFVPPEGQRLFFLGQDYDSVNTSLGVIGDDLSIPGGFSSYTAMNVLDQYDYGLAEPNGNPGERDWTQGYLNINPEAALLIAVWIDYEHVLDEYLAGMYDPIIDYFSRYVKSIQRPVFVRLGYEHDNQWHAMNWGTWEDRRRNAEKFKQVWIHIVRRMREVNHVTNVDFVWHSMAGRISVPYDPEVYPWVLDSQEWRQTWPGDWQGTMEWYPGDEYVDWFAISYFSDVENSACDDTTCCLVENRPLLNKAREFVVEKAREHGKPLMIAESGISFYYMNEPHPQTGQDMWDYWFEDYFFFIEEHDVKAFTYINTNWDELSRYSDCVPSSCRDVDDQRQFCWGDSRVYTNEDVYAQWRARLEQPDIIDSQDNVNELLGFTPDASVPFRRGDANGDCLFDLSDAVKILDFLFANGEQPGCMDAADANDDGRTDLSDAIKILKVLFANDTMPLPHSYFGIDPTEDSLSCDQRCLPE